MKTLAKKETILFAGRQMFTVDKRGNVIFDKKGVFQLVNYDLDSGELPVKEFSPDLKTDEFIKAIDEGFKLSSSSCGYVPAPYDCNYYMAIFYKEPIHDK